MEFYWELKYGDYKDLKSVMIPPASVEVVKRRWDNGDPIHLSTGSIPANQIREFQITDKSFTTQPLLEAAAQAFDEPLWVDVPTKFGYIDHAVEGRWVKRHVTMDKWNRYYSAIPRYKFLGEEGGMAVIASLAATHTIDQNKTPYCNEEEIKRLAR